MAPAKRRPAGRAAGQPVSTIEALESRQFLAVSHGVERWGDPADSAPPRRETGRAQSADLSSAHGDPRGAGETFSTQPTAVRREPERSRLDHSRPSPDRPEPDRLPEIKLQVNAARPQLVEFRTPFGVRSTVIVRTAPAVAAPSAAVTPSATFAPSVIPPIVRVRLPAPPAVQLPPAQAAVTSAPPAAAPIMPQAARQGAPSPAPANHATAVAPVVTASTVVTTITLARAAAEVLSGSPIHGVVAAGVVEGAATAAAASGSITLGPVQTFFSVARAVFFDDNPPTPAYDPAMIPVEAADVPWGDATLASADPATAGAVETAIGKMVPRRFFHIARVDALAAFNDAMAAFVDESASLPRAGTHRRLRAWVITAVVLAADAALLVSWHRSRAKKKRAATARNSERSARRPAASRWRCAAAT